MTDHIYGRTSLLSNANRPHMFIKELELYVGYFKGQVEETKEFDRKTLKNLNSFKSNLLEGINYYRELAGAYSFPN